MQCNMSGQKDWLTLQVLLEARLNVIADHEWRGRDPEAHWQRLREVSEAIMAEHEKRRGEMPPRLNHFLTQASYQKALDWLREEAPGFFSEGE